MKEAKTSYGIWIRLQRKYHGWTQQDLAKITGIHKSYISKIETGRILRLKDKTIKKLENAFDVPFASLRRK